MNIAIFYGGNSPEHEVSKVSASNVLQYPNKDRYSLLPIGVTKKNHWYLQEPHEGGTLKIIEHKDREVSIRPGRGLFVGDTPLLIDVAVIMIHGSYGEDGVLQGTLESAGVPYTGANLMASALGMDKIRAKMLWEHQNLPVTPYTTLTKEEWENEGVGRVQLQPFLKVFPSPLFIKPSRGGSSLGISRVTSKEEFLKGIQEALLYDKNILIELGLTVREIEFAALGDRVFHPGEIQSTEGFYSYYTKYEKDPGDSLIVQADLPVDTLKEMQQIALKAYKVLGIDSFARIDLFLTAEGEIYINEINTIPGMTAISMFPATLRESGISGEDLFDQWVQMALERHN